MARQDIATVEEDPKLNTEARVGQHNTSSRLWLLDRALSRVGEIGVGEAAAAGEFPLPPHPDPQKPVASAIVISRLRHQRIRSLPGRIREKGRGLDAAIKIPGLSEKVKQKDVVVFTR